MKHYIDILIQPNKKFRQNVLLNEVYTKFHWRLFSLKSSNIGVSFPDYNIVLGKTLRIHGNENELTNFQNTKWLGNLAQYCLIGIIRKVPDNGLYRIISRKQSNMTEAKLRRLIKRNSISTADIKLYKNKMFNHGLDEPYMELVSNSNKHKHRRYLTFGELTKVQTVGQFDCFGLSKNATIPWF